MGRVVHSHSAFTIPQNRQAPTVPHPQRVLDRQDAILRVGHETDDVAAGCRGRRCRPRSRWVERIAPPAGGARRIDVAEGDQVALLQFGEHGLVLDLHVALAVGDGAEDQLVQLAHKGRGGVAVGGQGTSGTQSARRRSPVRWRGGERFVDGGQGEGGRRGKGCAKAGEPSSVRFTTAPCLLSPVFLCASALCAW